MMPFCLATLLATGCVATRGGEIVEASEQERIAVLGPSDVVEVRVVDEQGLTGSHQVTDEGAIRLPLVGSIPVTGLDPVEAQTRIEAAYNEKYLRDAQVSLIVKKYYSR